MYIRTYAHTGADMTCYVQAPIRDGASGELHPVIQVINATSGHARLTATLRAH